MTGAVAVSERVAGRAGMARALLAAIPRQAENPLVLLGDPEPVLAGAPSDIDIAIDIRDLRGRARLLLTALDDLPWSARLVQMIQHEAGAHYFVVAIQVDGRWELFHPDFTTDYVRVGRRFMTFTQLLDGAQPLTGLPGVMIPSPPTAAHYYVVKRVSKGSITREGVAYLGGLLATEPQAVSGSIGSVLGEEFGAQVEAAIRADDPGRFEAAARAARPALYARHPLTVSDRVAEAGRFLRRFLQPTGVSVAVYGTDGSGKGTLLEAIRRDVGPAFRARDEWHLLAHLRPGAEEIPVTDPHGVAERSPVMSLAKLVYYFARAWLWRAPRVFLARRRSRLVLLDRDVEDLWIDPRRYRFGLTEGLLRAVVRLLPRPDVALVLHADAETVLGRSKELDAATLEHLAGRYRAWAATRHDAVLIDANGLREEVAQAATGALFTWLEDRTARRLGLRGVESSPRRSAPQR